MDTSDQGQCKRCGAVVPVESTDKLCPACLMSVALEPCGEVDGTSTPSPGTSVSQVWPPSYPWEFGGYRLLGLLGRGGMGMVYEAEHISSGRRVALKMLGQQLDSPDLRKRFLREGRLAAGVSHPNSLYVFGSEEIEGLPVITMEIAESGTLKDKLKKYGPLPVKQAVDAVLDIISGLESAHTVGVLHRDIKPSNCFVCPDGSVKVGDFGLSVSILARSDSFITQHGKILGTPAYASPEQLRGDTLDVRADIYSVGATLYSLLTDRPPFEGENAVQVVANAMNKVPKPLSELRDDVSLALSKVVARCLAKEPDGRFADYSALRNALLPFSSREPEPASLKIRSSAGWIDYLLAFLLPYLVLMLLVGNEDFHFQMFMERTLHSARVYILFLCFGFLYFSIVEGIWGAGVGKRLKGLRVIRTDGRTPGIGRAFIRIFLPILCIEGVRIPLLLVTITATDINFLTGYEILVYSAATLLCPWIPALLTMRARRETGYATFWDLASGTRVVVKPTGTIRPTLTRAWQPEKSGEGVESIGPYQIFEELVPDKWIVAMDPVLRRRVWLLRRTSSEPSPARRNVGRPGRLRWLQKVEEAGATWDAFEAQQGESFCRLVDVEKKVSWKKMRHWLHDVATELWAAEGDQTLPTELSFANIWITGQGQAVLLDEPWPDISFPLERFSVVKLDGQQRFLSAIAAYVESTSLPIHARPVLTNLRDGKFEKLSFLTGTLRGLLDRPADVSKGIRAGSMFMIPFWIWIMFFVGAYQGAEWLWKFTGDSVWSFALITGMMVLTAGALIQILEFPFRSTTSNYIFRLAVIDERGERAGISTLLRRWVITWLPLLLPISLVAPAILKGTSTVVLVSAFVWLFLWIGAAVYAVTNPNRGLHDRLAGTWVVRM